MSCHTPSTITAAIGRSFSTVVSTWSQPTVRTPRRLSSTKNQTSASAVSGGQSGLLLSAGSSVVRYPTAPVAIAALATQTETQ